MERKHVLIGCEVMRREFERAVLKTGRSVFMHWLPRGLHDLQAESLRAEVQRAVDKVEADNTDAVLLAYGLCNNAMAGLRAGSVPLVIPRAHDCITLFLGDAERYRSEFDNHPGTYYLTSGWIEFAAVDEKLVPQTIQHRLGMNMTETELIARYGEDNARFIMENLNQTENYDRLAFISTGGQEEDYYETLARKRAEEQGMNFVRMDGDLRLIESLVKGPPWQKRDFLVVPPGGTIRATNDHLIVCNN